MRCDEISCLVTHVSADSSIYTCTSVLVVAHCWRVCACVTTDCSHMVVSLVIHFCAVRACTSLITRIVAIVVDGRAVRLGLPDLRYSDAILVYVL